MRLFLDIETIPSEDPVVIASMAAGINAPANYKNPESIAKWEAENKLAIVEDQVRKTALDATYGSICCIGYAWDDEPPTTISAKNKADESGALCEFMGDVLSNVRQIDTRLEVVGHNVQWDLRFIYQRCIVHRVKPPHKLLACIMAKPWGDNIRDTMLLWHPDRDRKISLDKLCKVLGVQSPKGEMDGSKVYDAYKAGEWREIAAYCSADVEAVRNVFRRLTFIENRGAA